MNNYSHDQLVKKMVDVLSIGFNRTRAQNVYLVGLKKSDHYNKDFLSCRVKQKKVPTLRTTNHKIMPGVDRVVVMTVIFKELHRRHVIFVVQLCIRMFVNIFFAFGK